MSMNKSCVINKSHVKSHGENRVESLIGIHDFYFRIVRVMLRYKVKSIDFIGFE